ncbi:MAG TPA: PRC-barrel domain-containing protein [Methylomirabilota bacterium]|nr:PRC-barrel domain-containing protein [Methylomirabilota bacterium]
MNKTFRTMLFATALFPVAALAQDATTPAPEGEAPLIVVPNANQPAATDDMIEQEGATEGTAQTEPAMDATEGTAQTEPAMDATEPSTDTVQEIEPEMTEPTTDMAADDPLHGEIFVTVPPTGAWRIADLVGKDVYGSDNEDIGEINDVIVSQDGRVAAVIVGVGGFLGIGEKDVAVSMKALEFGPGMTPEEVAAKTGGAVATGTGEMAADEPVVVGEPAQTGAVVTEDNADMVAVEEGIDVEIGDDALPTRIVLNVTREQLDEAPSFEGIRASAAGNEQPLLDGEPAPVIQQ